MGPRLCSFLVVCLLSALQPALHCSFYVASPFSPLSLRCPAVTAASGTTAPYKAGCIVHMCWLRLALPFRYRACACHHDPCVVGLLPVGARTLLRCARIIDPSGACPSCRLSQYLMPVLHRLHPGAHSCLPLLTRWCHLLFFWPGHAALGLLLSPGLLTRGCHLTLLVHCGVQPLIRRHWQPTPV